MSTDPTDRKVVRVHTSVSLEGMVEELKNRLSHLSFETVQTVSFETQQMDEVAKQEGIQDIRRELLESLKGERTTGALQLFLLDGAGVAGSQSESEATLRALAKAAINDSSNIIAAFLPDEAEIDSRLEGMEISEATRRTVRHFLDTAGIKTVNSMEELVYHLTR